jgi:hypothetical protein
MRRLLWALVLAGVTAGGLRANETIAAGQPLALAVKEKVQKELGLTPEQAAAVKKLYAEAARDQKSDAPAALARELKPAQMKRLREISYQVRGGSVLADAEVVKELGLSAAQGRKIARLWKDEEENLRQVLRVARFRNAAVRRKFILEHRRDAGKKMLGQLTDEQAAALKKLQGKPFDLAGLDT